jgi:hypothetical protein
MKLSLDYIAGCLDCDGSFSISVAFRSLIKGKYRQIELRPVINFRQIDKFKQTLEDIQSTLKAGKIYKHSHKGNYKMLTWQTTTKIEALNVAKIILPYLHIKKDICKEFIGITEEWLNSVNIKANRKNKELIRSPEKIVELAKRTLGLNLCNQTDSTRQKRENKLKELKVFLNHNYES